MVVDGTLIGDLRATSAEGDEMMPDHREIAVTTNVELGVVPHDRATATATSGRRVIPVTLPARVTAAIGSETSSADHSANAMAADPDAAQMAANSWNA